MKNMLNFKNFTADELMDILNLALDMKKNPDKYAHALEGKKLYTLFEKTSTRTFLSFTTGITELGGTYYNQLWKDSNFTLGEPVSEIKYVCRNVDIIMARLVKNETVELFGNIAGVMVLDGEVKRGTKARILRDGVTTFNDLEISSLRRFKDDVKSVTEGYEAGINLGNFNDIEIGDIIETFEMQEIERK